MQHEASGHATYRTWCRFCVQGKARASAHVPQGRFASELPEVVADFCEFPRNGCLKMVFKDRASCAFGASTVTDLTADSRHSIRFVKAFFQQLCHRRILLKSDGEPALCALLRNAVAATAGLECVQRNSAPGDPASNGAAERAVSEVKAHLRVLLADLLSRYPDMDGGSPLLPWMPRHVGTCLTRFRILGDGRTAHWRLCGRRFNRPVVRFGEVVDFISTGSCTFVSAVL